MLECYVFVLFVLTKSQSQVVKNTIMKIKIIVRALVILGFATSLMACNQEPGYVWHDGRINHENVSIAIERMETVKNLGVFYISSGGGEASEGIRLGKYLQEREIPVVVVGRCFSACANYVLLPAKHRFAVPWAKIGMHGGYRSYLDHSVNNAAAVPELFRSVHLENIKNGEIDAAAEAKLLQTAGVNPEIIDKSARETNTGAIVLRTNRGGLDREFVIGSKLNTSFELWFPKREDYKKWGIDIAIMEPSLLPSEIHNLFSNFSDDTVISDVP